MILSSQYRNMKFTKYSQLISHLLLNEKHQEILLQNTSSRPPGTQLITNANTNIKSQFNQGREKEHQQYNKQGRGRGNGKYINKHYNHYNNKYNKGGNNTSYKRYEQNQDQRGGRGRGRSGRGRSTYNGRGKYNNTKSFDKDKTCYRCGTKGHTKEVCKMPKHLVALYQKANQKETHSAFLESQDIFGDMDDTTEAECHMILTDLTPPKVDDMNTMIVDSGTTHSILRSKEYFLRITPSTRKITTIKGPSDLEQGHGPAKITLPQGTIINIELAIFAPDATRNLLSFKDLRNNDLHIHTSVENGVEIIHLLKNTKNGLEIKETLFAYTTGLYITRFETSNLQIEINTMHLLWHERLGHPGQSMLHKIIKNCRGIPNNIKHIPKANPCMACSKGKLIIQPAISKTQLQIPKFLERIHADICGPIDPPTGPFCYFMVMIDASSKWTNMTLLSTRNLTMPKNTYTNT